MGWKTVGEVMLWMLSFSALFLVYWSRLFAHQKKILGDSYWPKNERETVGASTVSLSGSNDAA